MKLAELPALVDLVFVGNPLEEKYSADGTWITEATKRVPKLNKLDGEKQFNGSFRLLFFYIKTVSLCQCVVKESSFVSFQQTAFLYSLYKREINKMNASLLKLKFNIQPKYCTYKSQQSLFTDILTLSSVVIRIIMLLFVFGEAQWVSLAPHSKKIRGMISMWGCPSAFCMEHVLSVSAWIYSHSPKHTDKMNWRYQIV